jgi:biopolymer transport protein ExbB
LIELGHNRQPRARLLAHAITGLRRLKDQPPAAMELLREELNRAASAQLEQLRAWLRALEVIAALSPLLGLLGTVLGMIEAFRQLELAGSQVDPAILSGGIWQALLTTAAGLSVAIPVVLLHSWLERRVERCAHGMEDAVTRLFTDALIPMREDARPWSPEAGALTAHADSESESVPAGSAARGDDHALTKRALGDAA